MAVDPSAPRLPDLADRHYAPGDLTRKAPSYLAEYERILGGRRQEPLRILELGVSSGASLLIWRDWLPQATIVGIDIATMPEVLAGQPRIHFLRASQDDHAALDHAAAIAGGPFDLIIDDASHLGYLTKRSFTYLFPTWLKPGGTYVIEDFGTGYLPEYPDGHAFVPVPDDDAMPGTREFRSHQFGMAGVVKQLIDHMMQELITHQPPPVRIARMTILTNVALVEKAADPVPAGPSPAADPMLERRLVALEARVTALEGTLGRLLQRLAPLRRIRRLLSRA